ncbi:hypothetical protein [Methanosarcina sp. MSH10X1]|uniref:hypothetical protein n=1 Tax=Methanosarcina sp. MSH10X1 TaxID=2507075 RepID=UPI0013E4059C|nr:hypothetical protein [Methanosarcina sp. MSH10X1]
MKTIILIILILLSISLVGLGYIESKPNSYDLKYNFDEGDVFATILYLLLKCQIKW